MVYFCSIKSLFNKMMLRTILLHSSKLRYSRILSNVIRISSLKREMSYSLGLHITHFLNGNYNFQYVSRIFSLFANQFQLKCSYTATKNGIQNLCDLILPELPEDSKSQRSEELKKVISFLLSKGYSKKEIKEKFMDYLKSDDCSCEKFNMLATIHSDIVTLLPLLSLPMSVLKTAADKAITDKPCLEEFPNRILYLSHHLELEPIHLIPILAKHSSLLTMKFQRLELKMKILKDANISPEYIVKDLWIFNYTEKLLSNRIQAALKAGIQLKPWMLRCSESVFQSVLRKYSETQRILNGEDMHTYLSKKLDCSVEYVKYMMERNKLLKTINVPKLEQIINFLYEKGYTPEEVRLFPRVFSSSLQTLEKRLEEFQTVRRTLPSLTQLCMSNKNTRAWLDKYS